MASEETNLKCKHCGQSLQTAVLLEMCRSMCKNSSGKFRCSKNRKGHEYVEAKEAQDGE